MRKKYIGKFGSYYCYLFQNYSDNRWYIKGQDSNRFSSNRSDGDIYTTDMDDGDIFCYPIQTIPRLYNSLTTPETNEGYKRIVMAAWEAYQSVENYLVLL